MRPSIALMILMLAGAPAFAHTGAVPANPSPSPSASPTTQAKPVEFKLEKLSHHAYCLYGRGGNVGFLVTDAGVVVVDDQYEEVAQGIVDQIRSVTDRPIRFLVNTHYHGDHTGGNPVFIKMAEIVAHDSVRPRLLEYPETINKTFPDRKQRLQKEIDAIQDAADPYRVALEKDLGLLDFMLKSALGFDPAKAAPPIVTFDGRMSLWLGGEEVDVVHVAPGHTDGDSMVYFAKEKVLHMGDLFFNGIYPFIDTLGGGSARGYVTNIDQILTMVPPDTKVIPGHGPVTDVATLRRFRSFMYDLIGAVETAVKAGRSKPEAVRSIRMDQYPEIKPTYRTLGNEIIAIYDEVAAAR
ncbi:MAG TPA: MBL fold metallo-hydrolase [Candidatus Polarisedimenticolia bacterium]|nr:MBL fold metallo-hydrolase [Candidatus Polarisedimenticolia bacterium]